MVSEVVVKDGQIDFQIDESQPGNDPPITLA